MGVAALAVGMAYPFEKVSVPERLVEHQKLHPKKIAFILAFHSLTVAATVIVGAMR